MIRTLDLAGLGWTAALAETAATASARKKRRTATANTAGTPAAAIADPGDAPVTPTAFDVASFVPIPATVPGCIHTDLLSAGLLDDPYFRDNETKAQWVGEVDWVYERTFTVEPDLMARERVVLRCEGLDTLATLQLNGHRIAETDNAFRVWEFDVKDRLVVGENKIAIRFASPISRVAALQAKRPLPNWGSGEYKIQGGNWIRKSQCNFGWDWGPKLLTCGIWRAIALVAFDTARIADLEIHQDHGRKGRVGLSIRMEAEYAASVNMKRAPAPLHAVFTLEIDGQTVARTETPRNPDGANATMTVRKPRLWWPNGLGAQPLYTLTAELRDETGVVLDVWTRRLGLRTLELVREKDRWGESFCFEANGARFFGKGANWIPADTFVTRIAPEDYRRLLGDAAEAHMNLIRVWGGGIYEQDAFYEACDELGICVWQDFMFACATYPTFDASFMRNVEIEARQVVRRLRHRPSLALWCGNNELEQGLVGDEWNHRQMSWEDYKRLFDDLLGRVVGELDPDRPYWPCSPHTPYGDRRDFNNPDCGDAHLWSVWHGRQPFEWYRGSLHRFCSEFGFQSFPEPKTVRGYTEPQDRNITSFVMEHHQRSGIGNSAIVDYMLSWFRLPTRFDSLIRLSQILQGLGIKYAVDHWRRNRPRCMGAVYWQLNDCWPVASWSSIDWHGRWKALHYFAKRFFAPLAVTAVEDVERGTVALHVASDRTTSIGATLRWTLTDAAGTALAAESIPVRVAKQKSARVGKVDVAEWLKRHGNRDLVFWVDLEVEGAVVSSDMALFARPKHIEFGEPNIQARIAKRGGGEFEIALTAQRAALWTWLEFEGFDARFSDNALHLRPGQTVRLRAIPTRHPEATFSSQRGKNPPSDPMIAVATVREALRVHSLFDTYRDPTSPEIQP